MIRIGLTKLGFFTTAYAAGLATLFIMESRALAQEPSPSTTTTTATARTFNENGTEEATTERVFVTGSAIPTAAEVGPQPGPERHARFDGQNR